MLSSSRRKQLAPILSVGFLLLVWFVASLLVSSNLLLPGPGETIAEFTKILSSARGWSNIVETCSKAFIGLFLALGMAMVTGFLMGLIDVLYELLRPLVVILQSIPIVSWLALAIFWWGVGFSSPVYIVLLTLFPIFTINIAEGVRNVDKKLAEESQKRRQEVGRDGKSLQALQEGCSQEDLSFLCLSLHSVVNESGGWNHVEISRSS